MDIVVVRENTEDLYAGLEHEMVPGVAESMKIITERGVDSHRAYAFEYARKTNRKRVTSSTRRTS